MEIRSKQYKIKYWQSYEHFLRKSFDRHTEIVNNRKIPKQI